MSTKFQFSSEEDELLIQSIGNYPVLYDRSNKQYKNYSVKENLWRKISDKVKRTSGDCKKRWRNIRDTYMKIKRGNKHGTGSTAKPKSKWPLLQQLTFLDNVPFRRNTHRNVKRLEDSLQSSNTDTDNSLNFTSTDSVIETDSQDNYSVSNKRVSDLLNHTSKRQKCDMQNFPEILEDRIIEREKLIESINKTMLEDSDPVFTFFKSMAVTVKTFPPDLIAEAKSKVFNVINELEIRSLRRRSSGYEPFSQLKTDLS